MRANRATGLSPAVASTVTLANGRTLAYVDFGPQDGRPLLYVHGQPGSGFDLGRDELVAPLADAGWRLIGLDQPGFGGSPFVAGRSYSDSAADVAEAATALGFGRFAVLSFSAGGLIALACAARFPERLTAVCLLSPAAPRDMPGWRQSWRRDTRALIAVNHRAPAVGRALLRANARLARSEPGAVKAFQRMTRSRVDNDALCAHPEWVLRFAQQANRQGPAAFVENARRWLDWPLGFQLEDIDMPVTIFHGDADNLVRIVHSRYLASRLPHARLEELPGHGHVPTAEVLECIAQALPDARAQHESRHP